MRQKPEDNNLDIHSRENLKFNCRDSVRKEPTLNRILSQLNQFYVTSQYFRLCFTIIHASVLQSFASSLLPRFQAFPAM